MTRYRYNGIPADQPGRYVYLRDQDSGAYLEPHLAAGARSAQLEEGTSAATARDIRASASQLPGYPRRSALFRPARLSRTGVACELWVLRVRNLSDEPRHIGDLLLCRVLLLGRDHRPAEPGLGAADHVLRSGPLLRLDRRDLPAHPQLLGRPWPYDGFETDRETFMGRCRSLANPQAVELGDVEDGLAPVAGQQHRLPVPRETLQPGEVQELVYVLGITDDGARIPEVVGR